MIKNISVVAAAFSAVCASPAMAGNPSFSDISVAVGKYLDGTENGRPELLEEVMLPSLEVQWIDDTGELVRRPAPEFIAIFSDGQFRDRNGRIVAIDASGGAATVKIELTFNGRRYTDYLLMLQIDGKWKISNKIVSWEPLEGSSSER